MAAARQKEIKDRKIVVATTTRTGPRGGAGASVSMKGIEEAAIGGRAEGRRVHSAALPMSRRGELTGSDPEVSYGRSRRPANAPLRQRPRWFPRVPRVARNLGCSQPTPGLWRRQARPVVATGPT